MRRFDGGMNAIAPPRPQELPKHMAAQKMASKGLAKPVGIDDAIRHKFSVPGPHHYSPNNPCHKTMDDPKPGGKFQSRGISVHEHAPKSKAWVPGPGAYSTPDMMDFALPEGGRVNRQPPVEKLQMDEYPQPAPGEYGIPNDPTAKINNTGKFGRNKRVSKFIEDEVQRSRSVPAPGQYNTVEYDILDHGKGVPKPAKPFCSNGGKLSMSKQESYFDAAPKRWESNPGPGRYTLPDAINANKACGQVCFKYQSATLYETKALVQKLSSDATPGPGHYVVPDPEPLTKPIVMKSRAMYSMPAPYNYNCQPDLGNKFTEKAIVPVRQSNNGDQIYGNGFKHGKAPKFTGAGAKGSRPSSAGSTAKAVQVHTAPPMLQSPDIGQMGLTAMDINGEDAVQWRSGGFALLKKSRSAPAVRQLHPAVEQTKKTYGTLAKGKRDKSTHMPMCVRRPLEPIPTHESSEEVGHLGRGKMNLSMIHQHLEHHTASVLEPLDEKKLAREALEGLAAKARDRMQREGVGPAQQDLVIREMLAVLEDKQGKKRQNTSVEDGFEPMDSIDELAGSANEAGVNEISRLEEIPEQEYESYAEAIAQTLAQGDDGIAQQLLDFLHGAQNGLPSNFPTFEIPDGSHVQRITIEMAVEKLDGKYLLAYKSRSSVVDSGAA